MRFDGMGWDGMGAVQVAIHFVMCVGIGLWGCVASVGSMYVWGCLLQLQKVAWARQDSLALDCDSLGLRSMPGILAKSLRGTRTPTGRARKRGAGREL